MSAESPRKPSRQGGHVVAPQPVSDRSIIESVAGFINEVVPQGYTSSPIGEKEQITWARFEYADINDPALYPDSTDDSHGTAPLLLVLGYGSGVQVWAIPASGEATEVLSWRQGVVRTLRVLPTPTGNTTDAFAHKRPLVALCDSSSPGPQFCSLSFISLRAGDQVKSIKFKNPVNDVLANGRSVVVSFSERIAVFDASTLEDRLTITTCYPCPGPNPNPVALGPRWLAYAERKLIPAKRCSGGTEGEGIQSYTATVLHAAKSLGKGLRELGETVASSLTGGSTPPGARSAGLTSTGQLDAAEVSHPGIVTIVDAQGTWKENGRMEDNVIAHFTAHAEAIVALQFDPSGILLVTADKRGHDFHLFRIQPHPGGSSLAAVHHLYVLHRGDTTAKVQDITFSCDSRWVAVSTLRGTTHVFPITPYGGAVGLRTHSTPHVVNRLSRFHRSAGLTGDGRNSPQPNSQAPSYETSASQAMPYPNPRLPPYPHPTVVAPLAQIRQPVMHLSTPSSPNPSNAYHRNPSVRALGRNQSSSEDSGGIPLRVSASFAPSRAWLVGSPTVPRDSSNRTLKKAVDSLFVMACHGNLIEYDLETKHAAGIPKEKVCDDTPIELEVQAKAQWLLLRPPQSSEVQPPLSGMNPLMVPPSPLPYHPPTSTDASDERWLSHVEIVTHAGPHRRLWMGPQFTFKTYTASSGVSSGMVEAEGIDIGSGARLARSNPVNMPLSNTARPVVPFLIESGSGGSYEQSPRLLEVYGGSTGGGDSDGSAGPGETQLREELADAMLESPGVPTRDTGWRVIVELQGERRSQAIPIEKIVNPVGTVLTVITDEGIVDGKFITAENMETTVRWPTDVIKVIGKPEEIAGGKKSDKSQKISRPIQEQQQLFSENCKWQSNDLSKCVNAAPKNTNENVEAPTSQSSSGKQAATRKSRVVVEEKDKANAVETKSKDIIPSLTTTSISSVAENVANTNAHEHSETMCKVSVQDNKKDSKCQDKKPAKDAVKSSNKSVVEKPKSNQKKRKNVNVEMKEEKNIHSRSPSKTRGHSDDANKSSSRNSPENEPLRTKAQLLSVSGTAKEIPEMQENKPDVCETISDPVCVVLSPVGSDSVKVPDTKHPPKSKIKRDGQVHADLNFESKPRKHSLINSESDEDLVDRIIISTLDENVVDTSTAVDESISFVVEPVVLEPYEDQLTIDTETVEELADGMKESMHSALLTTCGDALDENESYAIEGIEIIEHVLEEENTALVSSVTGYYKVGKESETDIEPKSTTEESSDPVPSNDNMKVTKNLPVTEKRRGKAKAKNAASKISKEGTDSLPNSEKLNIPQAKASKDSVEIVFEVGAVDDRFESISVAQRTPERQTAVANKQLETSETQINESPKKNCVLSKHVLDQADRKDDLIPHDAKVRNTETSILKSTSARKPKKSELLPNAKRGIETDISASQAISEPSDTDTTPISQEPEEENETTASNIILLARKYQGLDMGNVKNLSADLPSRAGNKRGSKTKYKPFDMPVVSGPKVEIVSMKGSVQNSDRNDFPGLTTKNDGNDTDDKCIQKPGAWTINSAVDSELMANNVSVLESEIVLQESNEEFRNVMPFEDSEMVSTDLDKIRLSPPKLWSSIASTKTICEKRPCDTEVVLTQTTKSWGIITKTDDLSEECDDQGLLEESYDDVQPSKGVDESITLNTSKSEVESVANNDLNAPTLLQASKKNNKKKNKKRR